MISCCGGKSDYNFVCKLVSCRHSVVTYDSYADWVDACEIKFANGLTQFKCKFCEKYIWEDEYYEVPQATVPGKMGRKRKANRKGKLSSNGNSLHPNPGLKYLVYGISPRNITHVIIEEDGQMIHDPHPSGDGLLEKTTITFLVDKTGGYLK